MTRPLWKAAGVGLLLPASTHCPDICPLTTAKMKQIQDRLQAAGLGSQVQLVTVTVDPERDLPAVLERFADAYHANPGNWVFLTGVPDQIDLPPGSRTDVDATLRLIQQLVKE